MSKTAGRVSSAPRPAGTTTKNGRPGRFAFLRNVNNAVLCLLEHPDQLARLRAAPELLPGAIEEVLRYRSPVQWMPRATRCDVDLGGQVIPAGKLVLPMIGSPNRDPRQFRDAGRFDMTRDPNPHLAFGHGIHACLGAPLARLEGRIALADFLERVQGFELALALSRASGSALRRHVHACCLART
jgi:cytochrome P450